MENLKNLEKIAKIFQPQNIITSEEIDQVLKGIMEILASYKKGTDAINEETKTVVNILLEKVIESNKQTLNKAETVLDGRIGDLETLLKDVKTMCDDMETMMSEVKDGKDADEEKIVEDVINRIKIDPTVVTMSPEEIRDKLASLKDDARIDKSAIKGLEKVLQQKDLDYAIATLQQQTSFLINKGGLKIVSHDSSLSGDGTPENPLVVASTSGITLKTNGSNNGSQTILNLKQGTNMTITDDGSGGITFDASATGGSGITRAIQSKSADFTAGSTASTDYVYKCTASLTGTLPTAVGNTNKYTFDNLSASTITIATTGGQTINGSASATIPIQYMSLDLISDGTNWQVV